MDYYYVDKTGLIKTLLRGEMDQVTLITRPRRFGKTMAMSMLNSFLDIRKDSRELFEGLEISKETAICERWMNQYPTLFLSFKDVDGSTFENAFNFLKYIVAEGLVELRIPNKEIKEIFESTVRKWFEDSTRVMNRKALFDAVWNKDTDKLTKEISTLLRMTISYYDYREDFYHAFLAGIFAGAGYSVESNREYGEGRSDIVIYNDVTGQVAVFKAKYSRKLDDLERDCQKALDQIDTKMYAKKRNFKGAKTVTTRATSVTIKK